MISSQTQRYGSLIASEFQSRNRGSFDFKHSAVYMVEMDTLPFPSRNRGSFDFKHSMALTGTGIRIGFQSRNRGSFDFKNTKIGVAYSSWIVSIS